MVGVKYISFVLCLLWSTLGATARETHDLSTGFSEREFLARVGRETMDEIMNADTPDHLYGVLKAANLVNERDVGAKVLSTFMASFNQEITQSGLEKALSFIRNLDQMDNAPHLKPDYFSVHRLVQFAHHFRYYLSFWGQKNSLVDELARSHKIFLDKSISGDALLLSWGMGPVAKWMNGVVGVITGGLCLLFEGMAYTIAEKKSDIRQKISLSKGRLTTSLLDVNSQQVQACHDTRNLIIIAGLGITAGLYLLKYKSNRKYEAVYQRYWLFYPSYQVRFDQLSKKTQAILRIYILMVVWSQLKDQPIVFQQ